MEIVHNHESHSRHCSHPLLFSDGESEDNHDKPLECSGCDKLIICGPRFSCSTCKFHLHKSCTELPPRLLGHPLHPQHALSLVMPTSYHGSYCKCDACGGGTWRFAYCCSECKFNLHISCALSVDQEGNVVSEYSGEKDYFQYDPDQHLLMLEEEQSSSLETNGANCFVCSDSIFAPFFFCSRLRCKFQIHKSCQNLPKQIKNTFLHLERSLFLVNLGTDNYVSCQICGQKGTSFYVCQEPDVLIHPKCALSNPKDTMKRVGERQIQHRSHHHNLTLLEDEKDGVWTGNDHPLCNLCMEQLASSPSYGCELCKTFFIHKSCAELPGQIKSHLHPKHSLILFGTTLISEEPIICGCCCREVSDLNYGCLQCGFALHVDCFFSVHGSEGSRYDNDHAHSFVEMKRWSKSACDACGEENYFSPCYCTTCHVMVHKYCSELPRILKVDRHPCTLKLTYYLSVVHECEEVICQLCYKEVNVDYAVYYCRLCNYTVHLSCGKLLGVDVLEEKTEEDSSVGNLIQYISHEHELTLNEQNPEEHKYCEGCFTIISSPFYSCKDCSFYLHKQCALMPQTNQYYFHQHPLRLNQLEEDDETCCSVCDKDFNGFMYSCEFQDCDYKIDLYCVKLMDLEGVEHSCHEHRLYFPDPKIRENETCSGCGRCSRYILVCEETECKYALGICCAQFPQKVKHRYDDHLLNIAFKNEDEFGEYYCDICEYKRDPKHWFYCCIQCDFFAHMRCAMGDYPYTKFRTTRMFSCHEHPLTYVEQPMRKPPPLCDGCGKHCYSRVLECHQCSFNVHYDSSCTYKLYFKN